MFQAGIGDLREGEIQLLKMRQPLQMLQAGIRDLRAVEVQVPELRQLFQTLQVRIGDRRRGKISANKRCEEILSQQVPQPRGSRRACVRALPDCST